MSNIPNHVVALAMNHDPATLIVGDNKIPVLITDVSSEWSPVAASNTEIRCQVVNLHEPKSETPVFDKLLKKATAVGRMVATMNGQRGGFTLPLNGMFTIERVYFNNPVTVVLWKDGTKTVVKCQEGDTYSEETGLALCFAKKALGNKGSFNDVFKKFVPEEKAVEEPAVSED